MSQVDGILFLLSSLLWMPGAPSALRSTKPGAKIMTDPAFPLGNQKKL